MDKGRRGISKLKKKRKKKENVQRPETPKKKKRKEKLGWERSLFATLISYPSASHKHKQYRINSPLFLFFILNNVLVKMYCKL